MKERRKPPELACFDFFADEKAPKIRDSPERLIFYSALVITLVLENLNVTDGAKKFLLKRPKSKQFDDRS